MTKTKEIKMRDLVIVDGNKFATIVHINDDDTYEVKIIYFRESVIETVTKEQITTI